MKHATLLVLALASQIGMAQTIHCPGLGDLTPDGIQLQVNYSEKMGFSDRVDTGNLAGMSEDSADYRTQKWGALLVIPNVLIFDKATADITIFQAETAVQHVTCTTN